jgi:hypothetical protein
VTIRNYKAVIQPQEIDNKQVTGNIRILRFDHGSAVTRTDVHQIWRVVCTFALADKVSRK